MSEPHRSPGLLLVGHGTASEVGTRQFFALARQLAERLAPIPVEPAFLEIQQPDIAVAVRRLHEHGAESTVVVPLLLFAAGHAQRDIPSAVAAAVAALSPGAMATAQAQHLGCHPSLVDLSCQRFREVVAGQPPVPAIDTALLLVGRGSYDESATAEMHEFARLRHEPQAVGELFVGFLAMARPLLSEILPLVAARGFRRVVVQPHLLLEGELADTVRQLVAENQWQHPVQEWLIAPLLADSQDSGTSGNESLLQTICDRYREAAIRVVASWSDD